MSEGNVNVLNLNGRFDRFSKETLKTDFVVNNRPIFASKVPKEGQ